MDDMEAAMNTMSGADWWKMRVPGGFADPEAQKFRNARTQLSAVITYLMSGKAVTENERRIWAPSTGRARLARGNTHTAVADARAYLNQIAHAVGAWSDNDLAYAEALKRLRDVDYAAASGGEGLGQKVARVVAPLTLPVGEGARALIPAAGKVAAVGRGLLEGGAFAAMQPSGTASLPQKARQIAVGASFGGAVAPIAAAADKAAVALSQRSAARLAANRAGAAFADFAESKGVPMTAGEAGMTMGALRPQELQRGDVALEKVPGVGLQGFREQQQRGVRQMVEQAAGTLRSPMNGENWGRVGTASAQRKAQAVKATVRKLYGAVRDKAEESGITIAPTNTLDAVKNLQTAEGQRVLQSAQSPALSKILDDIQQYGTTQVEKAPARPYVTITDDQLQWPGLQTPPKPHEIPIEEVRSVNPRTGEQEGFTVEADKLTNRLPAESQYASNRDWLKRGEVLARSEGRDYATTLDVQRAYDKAQWDKLPRGIRMRELGLSVPQVQEVAPTVKPFTFAQAQQLDDDLGRIIDAQYQGGQNATIGTPGAAQLQQIRQALRADMDAAAKNSGRGDLFDSWKKADRFYKQQAVPLKATVLRGVLKPADGTDPTAAFQTFVRNASKGDAQFLYDRLDPAGRAAVRSGLIDDALGEAMKQRPGGALPGQTGDFLSPAQFVNALEKRREALGVFFKGREAQEWAGIENILRHVPRAGQFLENPPTGARLADPMTLLLSGAGGLAGAPTWTLRRGPN